MKQTCHAQCCAAVAAAAVTMLLMTPATLFAADSVRYPTKVVRVLVGYAPGGAVDVSARIVAQKLTGALGQSVLVENRPGADGNLASDFVAKAAPDGHTLAYVSAGHTMNPATYGKRLPYHPVRDFAPVSMLASGGQTLVVNPSLPVRNVKELVALAKAKPGAINFASSGYGGPMHLASELLKSVAHINIVHVPYKGGAPAVNDVIAGQIEMTFVGAPASLPHVRSGRLRLLAVSTPRRMSMLPDVPTVAESGYPGFDIPAYYSVLAPAGTPATVVNRLHGELAKVVSLRDVREKFTLFGVEPVGNTPEQLTAFMHADVAKWAKLVQAIGLKTD